MIKVIFLNGPPRSGKDTVARFLERDLSRWTEHLKFSTPLKNAVHALFGLDCSSECFDEQKDDTLKEFMYQTPRQAYIDLSEKYVKPRYHKEFLGLVLLRELERLDSAGEAEVVVISDSGFVEEARTVINKIEARNCLLVRLYRENYIFENDSRSYIKLPSIDTVSLMNDGNLLALEMTARTTISSWLREKQ